MGGGCIYIYICSLIYIYIYIFIEREGERVNCFVVAVSSCLLAELIRCRIPTRPSRPTALQRRAVFSHSHWLGRELERKWSGETRRRGGVAAGEGWSSHPKATCAVRLEPHALRAAKQPVPGLIFGEVFGIMPRRNL